VYLIIGLISHFFGIEIVKNNLTNTQSVIFLIILPIILFMTVVQLKINAKVIYLDFLSKKITFENYFIGKEIVYEFDEIDGYVDTFMKSPRGDFRVFYLVKNNMLTNKISGRIYSNIEEIEEGLKQLKYLGFHKFSLKWSLKILFHSQTPNK